MHYFEAYRVIKNSDYGLCPDIDYGIRHSTVDKHFETPYGKMFFDCDVISIATKMAIIQPVIFGDKKTEIIKYLFSTSSHNDASVFLKNVKLKYPAQFLEECSLNIQPLFTNMILPYSKWYNHKGVFISRIEIDNLVLGPHLRHQSVEKDHYYYEELMFFFKDVI